MRRRIAFRRSSLRRRSARVEMQQLSICREPLILSGNAPCNVPDVFFGMLVNPRAEFAADQQGSPGVLAFAKGVGVRGVKFRYAFSFNSGNVSVPQATDICTIHSALVVCPLDPDQVDSPLVPPSGFLFAQKTQPEPDFGGGAASTFANFRVLWRGFDKLKLYPDLAGPFAARLESTAFQPQGNQLQVVKANVRLDMDHCLIWLIEIAYGMVFDEGTNTPLVSGDLYGVAAVRPYR